MSGPGSIQAADSRHAASTAGFGHQLHAEPRELGLDAPLKLATSLAPEKSGAFGDWE